LGIPFHTSLDFRDLQWGQFQEFLGAGERIGDAMATTVSDGLFTEHQFSG
jgi:hypothetical protein